MSNHQDKEMQIEQRGTFTRLTVGPKPENTTSCIEPGSAPVRVQVNGGPQRISVQGNRMKHEGNLYTTATSGDLAREVQRMNPESVTATARSPGGRPLADSEIRPDTVVVVQGMSMQAKMAEQLGFIVKNAAGGYLDA